MCVVQKCQMPPVEEMMTYRALLLPGCRSSRRPAPSIIFEKYFYLTCVSVFGPCWCNTSTEDFRFLFPAVLPVWILSTERERQAGCRKRRKERRGKSSSVRPSQGCCPCSLCAWGTAFALAESAAGRGKRRNGIIRDRMQPLICFLPQS